MNKTEKTTFTVPSSAELEQLAELHKAMGDYTRMRILWYLMQKEYCVSDLAQKMEITESAISHQLRALRIARLAQSHKAGKNVIYGLGLKIVQQIVKVHQGNIQFSNINPHGLKIEICLPQKR